MHLRGISRGTFVPRVFPNVDARFPGRHGKVQAVTKTSTLEDVIRMMATTQVHRVFVVNNLSDMIPVDIITQTDILRFMLSSIRSWW
jgi:CBS domain-containing protein